MLACITLGILTGHLTLRGIILWCSRNLKKLSKYMPLENGIASLSTMSRILSGIDEQMFAIIVMIWMSQITGTRNAIIAIDGKGLRAGTEKIKGGRTPYVLNAFNAGTGLAIGHLPIDEKKNEITAIPELLKLLDIQGSIVTIDAIGRQTAIMKQIVENGGHFVLQVKKNQLEAYENILGFFNNFNIRQRPDLQTKYSMKETAEKNRERYEYRQAEVISDPETFQKLKTDWPFVRTFGVVKQTRIDIIRDKDGNDVTPDLETFLRKGSSRQPDPTTGDDKKDDTQIIGIISDLDLTAKDILDIKRGHWKIEVYHHVTDRQLREDESPATRSKNNLALLRKLAYNLIQLAKIDLKEQMGTSEWMDLFAGDPKLQRRYVFSRIASLY